MSLLASDRTSGLSPDDVARRRARCGPNALPEARRRSVLSILLRQFQSPLVYLLLGAAVIAFVLGEHSDAVVISVVVLLNASIGGFQEGRAEAALTALRQLARQQTQVVRDGRAERVDARDLVPGDIVVLAPGDAVPADARLVDVASVQTGEAALTGESVPVAKVVAPVAADAPLGDRSCMLYAGTHLTAGRARGVVVATGWKTELGRIASLAEAATPPATPLERRIDEFGRAVMVAALLLFGVIIAVGLLRDLPVGQIAMIGISQVVGMIPEGLPVAMTIALAVGVQRMARRRAIVRRLSAVETLGSTTVVCSDKTGTLTRNEMTVTAILMPGRPEITVNGVGNVPTGAFHVAGRPLGAETDPALRALLEAAVLCNDAQYLPSDGGGAWRALGDPTEVALVVVGMKGGVVPEDFRRARPRTGEIPFDAGSKMMATAHGTPAGSYVVIKGAPEAVLDLCGSVCWDDRCRPFDDEMREQVRAGVISMANRALRVLAIATVDDAGIDAATGFEPFHGRATLLGLVGQIDPPRAEAAAAVARCRTAGIRPVMVTGDHKATGLAIAQTLGIARDGDRALDGRELDELSDEDLAAQIDQIAVFARVHPAQKLRIVETYQRRHEVVAMTGDGVNDAPALARADVGVAMGITGTDVAKQAADVVITDDDFATIVAAVEEGRVVYGNIKKVILFLFATSLAEVVVLLGAMVLGYPPPFAAVQILWNNLVTEGVVTINLVMDPPEGDEMRRRPIATDEPLLTRALLTRLAFMTPAIVVSTLGWFVFRLASGVAPDAAQSEAFTVLVVCEWFNVLSCRSETRSALTLGVLRNPWLLGGLVAGNLLQVTVIFWAPMNRLFHTVPLHLEQVLVIGVVGSLVLWVEEIRKLVVRRRQRRGAKSLTV